LLSALFSKVNSEPEYVNTLLVASLVLADFIVILVISELIPLGIFKSITLLFDVSSSTLIGSVSIESIDFKSSLFPFICIVLGVIVKSSPSTNLELFPLKTTFILTSFCCRYDTSALTLSNAKVT